jgi:Leucine-rich repeat (LRR) protein
MADPAIERVDDALVDRVLSLNPKCRRLNVSHHAIVELDPACLPRLSSLMFLNLAFNRLSRVGAEIGALANLQALDVSHNAM